MISECMFQHLLGFVVFQSLSCVWLSETPWTIACQASLFFNLLEFPQIHVQWVCDIIQPSHPLLPHSPPALNLSQHQGIFQWLSSSHQMSKVLGFQLQHNPSKEYSGLISIRIGWFDLLSVQGILKSLLQHQNLKASILWCSAFFMIHLSHQYKTTGETMALTIWTLISKVMPLLFFLIYLF